MFSCKFCLDKMPQAPVIPKMWLFLINMLINILESHFILLAASIHLVTMRFKLTIFVLKHIYVL